jgi:hypothetical protein
MNDRQGQVSSIMPSKRSMSKEREKKRKVRLKMTDEQIETSREQLRKRMAKFRENFTDDEQEAFKEKDRLRKVSVRQDETLDEEKMRLSKDRERKEDIKQRRSEEEIEVHREYNRQKKAASRDNQQNEIKEYEEIEIKHKNRILRQNLSKDEKSELGANAKQGMSLLRNKGRCRKYVKRSKPNIDEFSDWKDYTKKSHDNLKFLELMKPDIVLQINEKARIEKEKQKNELREWKKEQRYKELNNKNYREVNDTEKKELEVMKQERHESSMKIQKEKDMEMIKALNCESLSSELDYWYEYQELVTTDPSYDPNYIAEEEACPGLKSQLKWMKKEKEGELAIKGKECQTNSEKDMSKEKQIRNDAGGCSDDDSEEEQITHEREKKMVESKLLKVKIGLHEN